jgi:hypothetical protein
MLKQAALGVLATKGNGKGKKGIRHWNDRIEKLINDKKKKPWRNLSTDEVESKIDCSHSSAISKRDFRKNY